MADQEAPEDDIPVVERPAYLAVRNPKWANAGHSMIDCEVEFASMPGAFLPFSCRDQDDTGYGQDIWTRAKAGAFGTIAPFVAPAPTGADVDAERDRRIALGFDYAGKHYQCDDFARANIAAMGSAASAAIVSGSQPGDMRWFNPAADFFWIASDNSHVPMDAQTTQDFALNAAQKVSAIIITAAAIKTAQGGIPAGFKADSFWP